MPCSDGGPNISDWEAQQERIDQLARMLCSTLTLIEELKPGDRIRIKDLKRSTRYWWAEHKRRDAKRIADEQAEQERLSLRKAALKKLTRAERRALAIADYD